MFSSYQESDVTILLKDITGQLKPLGTQERERLIQGGMHYSETLPLEYEPVEEYVKAYEDALRRYAPMTAQAVSRAAEKIFRFHGNNVVLVSLARAGTPIGILIKRYLDKKYNLCVPHYTISIIRDRGIDKNALDYILEKHDAKHVRFVDGWTGKGVIARELEKAVNGYKGLNAGLAVLSDPAFAAEICGTHEDFLIASSLLNCTVSGLLSRTVLRSDIIGQKDFHGAVFYSRLKDKDRTYGFIDTVEKYFDFGAACEEEKFGPGSALEEVRCICRDFCIDDVNLVKPGIGEATRVLLRRVPGKMLVHSLNDVPHLGHIYTLAKEKGVNVEVYPLKRYKACGIIQKISDI